MNNENALVPVGEIARSLEVGGDEIVGGRDTRLMLTDEKGNYLIGKFLGTKAINPAEGKTWSNGKADPITLGRFAVIETNMEGDTGPVVPGEVCAVTVSGLLAWALAKCAAGQFLFVRFDGKGPGKTKAGTMQDMNRFTVKDAGAACKARGIE